MLTGEQIAQRILAIMPGLSTGTLHSLQSDGSFTDYTYDCRKLEDQDMMRLMGQGVVGTADDGFELIQTTQVAPKPGDKFTHSGTVYRVNVVPQRVMGTVYTISGPTHK